MYLSSKIKEYWDVPIFLSEAGDKHADKIRRQER
jgi:hypothetical protein